VSRHAATLRDAGLLHARKQGTWLLLRLAPEATHDAVVADAVAAGMESCEADGTVQRIAAVVAARDAATREFFARGGRALSSGPPSELAAYLKAIAPLVSPRRLAVDAGTGDGALLEVLAPIFESVVALDRSTAQLELARSRASRRRFTNVRFVCGELDGPEISAAVEEQDGADAVFAARLLHHAPVPALAVSSLTRLARPSRDERPGGTVIILDYESHHDDALRQQHADLWLGFGPTELKQMAEGAGLTGLHLEKLPPPWCGEGGDRHLPWQVLWGRRGVSQS